MDEVFSGLLVFLIALCVSGLICFIIDRHYNNTQIKRKQQYLDRHEFLIQFSEEEIYLNNIVQHSEQFSVEYYSCLESLFYIREDLAETLRDRTGIGYKVTEKINVKQVIGKYSNYKDYLDKISCKDYYLICKPLSDLKEYFEDVDNPTQTELDYARMVLGDDKVKCYKEFDL